MTRVVTHGDFSARYTPPSIEKLKRLKLSLSERLDALTTELPILERRRDHASSASYNGGGEKAARQYERFVEAVAEKVREKARLESAIAGVDNQIAEEKQRLEDEKQRREDEREVKHREACIRSMMHNRKRVLESRLDPHKNTTAEKAEIDLQLANLRFLAELEYDEQAAIEHHNRPLPWVTTESGKQIPPDRGAPPMRAQTVSLFGLPTRPQNLGQK
jgi:hypothetical protein